jgi:hypothetical protein
MRPYCALVALAVAGAMSAFRPAASAAVLITIDKAGQRMTVAVDGELRWTWPVSTGRIGHDTPNGQYTAFRMEKDHVSREWDDAPMPYSIFFTRAGHAIHGTYATKRLGRAASHGCVRLAPQNAAQLFALVKRQGMANTRVVIAGALQTDAPVIASRLPARPPLPAARPLQVAALAAALPKLIATAVEAVAQATTESATAAADVATPGHPAAAEAAMPRERPARFAALAGALALPPTRPTTPTATLPVSELPAAAAIILRAPAAPPERTDTLAAVKPMSAAQVPTPQAVANTRPADLTSELPNSATSAAVTAAASETQIATARALAPIAAAHIAVETAAKLAASDNAARHAMPLPLPPPREAQPQSPARAQAAAPKSRRLPPIKQPVPARRNGGFATGEVYYDPHVEVIVEKKVNGRWVRQRHVRQARPEDFSWRRR